VIRYGPDVEKGQESCGRDILEALAPGPLTALHISESTGLKTKTVQNRLTVLQREGQMTAGGKDGRANLYRDAW
jgi:DNA-binding IclR family transcriptional regulator